VGGVRRGWASLGLEVRGDLPASSAAGGGRVSSWLLLAALVPCAHRGIVSACGLIGGGVQRGAGHDLVAAREVTLPHVALGVRLALELPLGAHLFARLHADLLAPLVRGALQVDDRTAFAGAPVEGVVGGALGATFR
jgi:hypothetical protein